MPGRALSSCSVRESTACIFQWKMEALELRATPIPVCAPCGHTVLSLHVFKIPLLHHFFLRFTNLFDRQLENSNG